MKRLLLLLLLFIFGLGKASVFGGSHSCVTKTGCPKDVKPPACCQPPPCELYDQIRTKQALKNLFKDKNVRAQMKKKGGGNTPAAGDLLYNYVINKSLHMDKDLKCSWTDIKFPPPFEVIDSCDIVSISVNPKDPTKPIKEITSQKEAQEKFDTCSEFIAASWAHEKSHTKNCDRTKMTLDEYADEEVAGYELELAALKEEVAAYYRACTTTPDAAIAKRLAKEKIEAYKKNEPPKDKDPRTQSKKGK